MDFTAFYPGPKLIHIVGGNTPCCGANFTYRLDFRNDGNAASLLPGVITLVLPANCTFVGAAPSTTASWTVVPPPNSGDPVSVVFNQPVPPNYQSWVEIEVHLNCDPTLLCDQQTPLVAQAAFFPFFSFLGECNWNDNFAFHTVTPCCSYDPNDCTVSPKGCGPEGLIHSDQALTYTVQFQNLGGGAAHLVVVNNTLDADLDLNTLEIVGSSHANLLQRNGRELTWIFPNIELASAGVDEKASHGYVKFRIRPLANALVGTVITNSAEIIFDVNAPLATITTTNTITEDPVPKAAFTVASHAGSVSAVCDFTYTGGTPGAQCQWYFGPDAIPQTSTALNPVNVSFTTPGPHLVSLQTSLGSCAAEPAIKVVTVGQPKLSIAKTGTGIGLTWQGDGFVVQETDNLAPPVQWQTVQAQPTIVGGWYLVNLPISTGARFYRLAEAP